MVVYWFKEGNVFPEDACSSYILSLMVYWLLIIRVYILSTYHLRPEWWIITFFLHYIPLSLPVGDSLKPKPSL